MQEKKSVGLGALQEHRISHEVRAADPSKGAGSEVLPSEAPFKGA